LEIIQNKDNLKPGELASKFGLPPSTISTIIERCQKCFQKNKSNQTSVESLLKIQEFFYSSIRERAYRKEHLSVFKRISFFILIFFKKIICFL